MKTSELQGPALDWAVAKCEGLEGFNKENLCFYDDEGMPFEPSCVWSQAGPIIEREKIALYLNGDDGWTGEDGWKRATGPTPLVAAMRVYVAIKLGDEVEVPGELLTQEV
jgi:hypothetical protein